MQKDNINLFKIKDNLFTDKIKTLRITAYDSKNNNHFFLANKKDIFLLLDIRILNLNSPSKQKILYKCLHKNTVSYIPAVFLEEI